MIARLRPASPSRRVSLFGLALAACLSPLPAFGLDLPPMRSAQPPSFTCDLAVSVDSSGAPGIGVTISLPYPELQWVRSGDGFATRFEIVAAFEPSHDGRVYGDRWQRQARVSSFDQTTSYESLIMERRTFRLPPGRFRLTVRVRDLDSDQESVVSESVDVPDYSRVPLALAELELGVVGPDGAFVPVPARQYGYDSARLAARVAVVDRREGGWPRSYTLRYRILDENGEELARGDRTATLTRPGEPAIVRPDSSTLFVGTYTFSLELDSGRSRWRTERTFEVDESGPPRGQEFRRMLEPLAYIAEPSEIDELAHLDDAHQAAGWDAFWKRRDPSPDTPRNEALLEFLRRVRYAEQHFQHFGPGWRSDMGRIYIKFGPPDQTESRAATLQSPQLEIWYYNHPYRQFVFADREGFGRYTLVSPGAE